jgi:DNA polymerase III epsilon subunit-like protein
MKNRIHNFFALYTESVEENRSEIADQLRDSGVDTDALKKNLLKMIKREEAQLKKERGKNFKEKYIKATGEENKDNNQNTRESQISRYAARKTKEGDAEVNNFDDDEFKLKLIKQIKQEKFSNNTGDDAGS